MTYSNIYWIECRMSKFDYNTRAFQPQLFKQVMAIVCKGGAPHIHSILECQSGQFSWNNMELFLPHAEGNNRRRMLFNGFMENKRKFEKLLNFKAESNLNNSKWLFEWFYCFTFWKVGHYLGGNILIN